MGGGRSRGGGSRGRGKEAGNRRGARDGGGEREPRTRNGGRGIRGETRSERKQRAESGLENGRNRGTRLVSRSRGRKSVTRDEDGEWKTENGGREGTEDWRGGAEVSTRDGKTKERCRGRRMGGGMRPKHGQESGAGIYVSEPESRTRVEKWETGGANGTRNWARKDGEWGGRRGQRSG